MPTYKITDPTSGKTVRITGDSPPSEQELNEIFNKVQTKYPLGPPTDTQIEPARKKFVKAAMPGVKKAAGPVIEAGMALAGPKTARPALEIGGATVGGLAGTAAGGPAGGFAGEALGYAGGKQAANLLEAKRAGRKYDATKELEKLPGDIAEGAVYAAGGRILGKAAGSIATKVGEKLYPAVDRALTKIIDRGINKGIRPSVSGKPSASRVAEYAKKARDAVRAIVSNKQKLNLVDENGEITGKLPATLSEFSQAIEQTKRSIFKQYDAMARSAGKYGPVVDMAKIADKLKPVVGNKPLNDFAPELVEYASKRSEQLRNAGSYTTEQMQEIIQHFNKSLEAFYKNPTQETAGRASIDALLVNNMRQALDDVIEKSRIADAGFKKATGKTYQELKNTYGALKAIEKDVNHRTIVDARKNIKGLIDFSDVFSGAEVVHGLLAMDPARFATGTAAKGIAGWYRYINSPNTSIKRMFKSVDSLLSRGAVEGKNEVIRGAGKAASRIAAYGGAKAARPQVEKAVSNITPSAEASSGDMTSAKRGIEYYTNNDWDNAIREWQKALKEEPQNARQIIEWINTAKLEKKKYQELIARQRSRGMNTAQLPMQ